MVRGGGRIGRGGWWGWGIGLRGLGDVNQELKVLLKEHKGIVLLYNFKNNRNYDKKGECGEQGGGRFDQNHLKLEKKTKTKKKKVETIAFGAGFEPTTLRLQIQHLIR